MKTNKYIMVDLLLLGVTIVLMLVFNVVFYPSGQNVIPVNETFKKDQIFKKTLIYKNGGNPDSALSFYNKALYIKTTDAKGYYLRAVINTGLGRTEEAFQDYSKAIKLNPDFFQAYLNRGLLSLKEKQLLKAVLDIVSALKISPLKSSSFLLSRLYNSIF